jgi:hypothetical protein
LEREKNGQHVAGVSYFKNSFNQPSLFIYPWGRRYDNTIGLDGSYIKWGAGLLYGYVDEYEDKVPFNSDGFSPGIIISLGWRSVHGSEVQLNFLGTAGVMLSLNKRL